VGWGGVVLFVNLGKESDGNISFTLATTPIDTEAELNNKTTVQLSNIDEGAAGINLTP
jgi:hypothetical protein